MRFRPRFESLENRETPSSLLTPDIPLPPLPNIPGGEPIPGQTVPDPVPTIPHIPGIPLPPIPGPGGPHEPPPAGGG